MFSGDSAAVVLPICREIFSSRLPLKLSPLIVKTVASSNIRSREHNSESSSLKTSLHCDGFLLLVKTMLKLPSFWYRLSIRSKNSRVFSLSNSQWPTSSMIRHDGRTRLLSTDASLPLRLAVVNLSLSSDILMKYVFRPCWQHSYPNACARCVFPMPAGPMKAIFLCACMAAKEDSAFNFSDSLPLTTEKSKFSKVFGFFSGSRLILSIVLMVVCFFFFCR